MSFDKNNQFDDMNIKSHLNTSFDLSGIVVSEDLIKRTLDAIKQTEAEQQETKQPGAKQQEIKHKKTKKQEVKQEVKKEVKQDAKLDTKQQEEITTLKSSKDNTRENEKSKKLIPWSKYVYRIAGVVAAALVVTVGLNLISRKNMSYNDMSTSEKVAQDIVVNESVAYDTETAQNSTLYDDSMADTATEDAQAEADTTIASQFALKSDAGTVQKSSAKEEASSSSTATSLEDTAAEDTTDTVNATDMANASDAANVTSAPDVNADYGFAAAYEGAENGADVTFRDIFLADPAQAEYITITDEINNNEIKLTDQKDILDFYSLMDQHSFTKGTGRISTQNYTIEVKSLQTKGIAYSVIIGDGVIVNDNTGDTVSKTFYNAAEETVLIKNLDDFFLKYFDN